MITLAIDTSSSHGSVAVLDAGRLIFSEEFESPRRHSAVLFTVLERAHQIAPRVDQIAVGLGPGSYAGVRVAIAAAIGMSLARGCALVGLPSIAAFDVPFENYHVAGDARRESLYLARVENHILTGEPVLFPAAGAPARLGHLTPLFSAEPLAPATLAHPSARILAQLAQAGRGTPAPLEPIYLREPHITVSKDKSPRP